MNFRLTSARRVTARGQRSNFASRSESRAHVEAFLTGRVPDLHTMSEQAEARNRERANLELDDLVLESAYTDRMSGAGEQMRMPPHTFLRKEGSTDGGLFVLLKVVGYEAQNDAGFADCCFTEEYELRARSNR